MLYYLFEYLGQFEFPGARMFGYVSFRSLMAIILALLISTIFGEYFITLLKKKQITEVQRDASIDPFNVNKKGVPTRLMGEDPGGGNCLLVVITMIGGLISLEHECQVPCSPHYRSRVSTLDIIKGSAFY